jgi:hypothetical protein
MTTTESPVAPAPTTLRRHRRRWQIAAAVVIAGAVTGGILLWRHPQLVAVMTQPHRWPGSKPADRTPDRLRVLFIGNSFTQYNAGLGTILQQLAESARKKPVPLFDQYTIWGATLQRLWDDDSAPSAIREGNWDYVVLQDYSIASMIYRPEMDQYGKRFAGLARSVGAEPVFFMTWARAGEGPTQRTITGAYIAVSAANSAPVAPVGLAFARVERERPDIGMINAIDGKHPTPAGSYLAGCVFYAVFYHESPVGLTGRISDGKKIRIDLSPADARYLQQAAWQTVTDFGPTAIARPYSSKR